MSRLSPSEMAKKIGEGLLLFPRYSLQKDCSFDEKPYREHISWMLQHKPAGLFAAGGRENFFTLHSVNFPLIVSAAVDETAGKVPVLAGCGYGTAMAKELAVQQPKMQEADGILLLPPYPS